MNTKRKVKDYIGQNVAIHCSTKEEWDKIVDLFPSDRSVKKIYWQNSVNNGKSDTINIDGYGWSPKKHYEDKGYTIYLASDFLEEIKSISKKDLKEGEIYLYNNKHICVYPEGGSLSISGKNFSNKHTWIWNLDIKSTTDKQKDWLNKCIKANKFIPYDEDIRTFEKSFKFNIEDEIKAKPGGYYISSPQYFAESHKAEFPSNKSTISGKITERTQAQGFNWYKCGYDGNWITEEGVELVKEDVPEYVEYIDTKYKGQIVKVEEWTNHNFCCIRFENGQREQPFKHLVKLSTKEAYEAQNKPKQLTRNNLLPNEIYVTDKPKNYIFKTSKTGKGYSSFICNNKSFAPSIDKGYIWTGNLRLAPIEEKKWLNVCICQNKFIPKENLHLYDDSGLLIKKEEAMFKKNDYIVVLYNDNSLNSWTNQCFKQLEDLYYLKVVKNLNGNTDGWSVINFKNQSKWRYASSAEILEYERIGKPFDVTTLIKKEKSLVKQVQEGLKLKDRWVKCVKECGWNTINVGEYIQILENNSLVPYVEWKDNKEKYCIDLDRIDKAEFELMPEGFSPNEKEWIPKIGDWCVTTTHYNDEIWYKGRIWQIGKIDEDGYHISIENEKLLDQSLKTGFRKASEKEIAAHLGTIIHNKFLNEYSLIPNECFKTSNYNSEDIHIPSITKKTKKLQTITIESTTDLNLNLTKIKSKQIQTIKI